MSAKRVLVVNCPPQLHCFPHSMLQALYVLASNILLESSFVST